MAAALEERRSIEEHARATARRLVRARSRQVVDGSVARVEGEAELELPLRDVLAALAAPARAGSELIGRVVGRG